MKNFLKNVRNREEDAISISVSVEVEEELLPSAAGAYLDLEKHYKQIMLFYESGIRQLTAKLEILNKEFQLCNDRNPIENVKSRIKTKESILRKMEKQGLPLTFDNMMNYIHDGFG